MQILTDRASDLAAPQLAGLNIHFVPMRLTLDDKTYSSGEDLSPADFYDLLETTEGFPVTSQPSAGDFAEIYRQLAKTDPEILSIHVSSGLSGTLNSAKAGAEMVPEAKVTFWDTKTLSCPEAWQVEAAARGLQAGWPLEKIQQSMEKIRQSAEGIYTLDTLKYLIHGGRISHLKGLLASVLHIRPVIGVEKESGKYYTLGQERTMKRALQKLAEIAGNFFPEGTPLRVQLLHGKNPEGLEILHEMMASRYPCQWTPTATVGPILGAHTGGGLVGLSVGPADIFRDIPGIVMQ
ncbi:MAG TPA: DegV family protein [Anaerolineaceae bacterium]